MMSGSDLSGSQTSSADAGTVIAGVLDTLRESRLLLLDPSPQNIDRCRSAIGHCVRKVSEIFDADRSAWNSSDLHSYLVEIRGELKAIEGLLDTAAAWRRDLLSVMSAASRARVVDISDGVRKAGRVHVLG